LCPVERPLQRIEQCVQLHRQAVASTPDVDLTHEAVASHASRHVAATSRAPHPRAGTRPRSSRARTHHSGGPSGQPAAPMGFAVSGAPYEASVARSSVRGPNTGLQAFKSAFSGPHTHRRSRRITFLSCGSSRDSPLHRLDSGRLSITSAIGHASAPPDSSGVGRPRTCRVHSTPPTAAAEATSTVSEVIGESVPPDSIPFRPRGFSPPRRVAPRPACRFVAPCCRSWGSRPCRRPPPRHRSAWPTWPFRFVHEPFEVFDSSSSRTRVSARPCLPDVAPDSQGPRSAPVAMVIPARIEKLEPPERGLHVSVTPWSVTPTDGSVGVRVRECRAGPGSNRAAARPRARASPHRRWRRCGSARVLRSGRLQGLDPPKSLCRLARMGSTTVPSMGFVPLRGVPSLLDAVDCAADFPTEPTLRWGMRR
jgi:hypothetical protein